MNGVCGWTGGTSAIAEPVAVLRAMLVSARGGERGDEAADPALVAEDFCAAAFAGRGDTQGLVFADEDLVVAVTERLRGGSGRDIGARELADLYRAHKEQFLRRVRGTFAVAVFDRRERRLVLAVDRAGVTPLYFARVGAAIAFSTRLDGLRPFPTFEATISNQALFDYLYFHVVPSPGTIYRGCEKLLPAQMLVLSAGGRQELFYWSMPYRDDNPASFESLRGEFRELLPQAVRRAADGGVTIGAFLSGGTDSSTVAGTLSKDRGTPLPTYSMGFEVEGFDEIEYARIAARHFGTDSREYYVTPEQVCESIPTVAAWCDEPFGNASVVPAYLCARAARADGIERMLAGDGGDEIFGGNARYANQWVFELYGRIPPLLRDGIIEPVAFRLPGAERIPLLRKVRSYIDQAKVPLPDRLETYNFLHRSPLADIFEPGFLDRVDTEAPLRDLRGAYGRADSASPVNRMMHLDLKITLADNDLRKVNQACSLAGVEVRYPLLDDEMLELAASVPPHMQLRRTQLRWFFKKALADFLPPEIIRKKKHGFGLPVGAWMAENEPLRALTHDTLAAFRRRGIVQPGYLDWIERQHADAHASYYGVLIWVVVMLEQWLQSHGH